MRRILYFIALLLLFPVSGWAQTVHSSATERLHVLQERWEQSRKKALQEAAQRGFPIRVDVDTHSALEIAFLEQDRPQYFITHAAVSEFLGSRPVPTDTLRTSNLRIPPLGLSDAGSPRMTHLEFSEHVLWLGDDNIPVFSHATAMAGAMVARGRNPEAQAPAAGALLHVWHWHDDPAQRLSFALNGGLISVHGYDVARGWVRNLFQDGRWAWLGMGDRRSEFDHRYGYYNDLSRDVDEIAWLAPHYLMVQSAGNEQGMEPGVQPTEHWRYRSGEWRQSTRGRHAGIGVHNGRSYRTVSNLASAKNVLTVGAYDSRSEIPALASFSSIGPTSDGRIKPEIVAPGVAIYTTGSVTDINYFRISGTSVAAALVGSHAQNLLGELMEYRAGIPLSSTMRALLVHTAQRDEEGPDYRQGWGIFSPEKAQHMIAKDRFSGGDVLITESELEQGAEQKFTVQAVGNEPLRITLAWTDPPADRVLDFGLRQTGILVHDLDLRVTSPSGKVWEPFVLDPEQPHLPAELGDNTRDNVEQILIANPEPGDYDVFVRHKRNLMAPQAFSLLMSGVQSPVLFPVTFTVDMRIQKKMQRFDPLTDKVMVSGSFTHWQEVPSDSTLILHPTQDDSLLYQITVMIPAWPKQEISYKLFVDNRALGWERNYLESDHYPNRRIQIPDSVKHVLSDTLFFNGETAVYQLRDVRFNVDMSAAKRLGFFKPDLGDYVFVRSSISGWSRSENKKMQVLRDSIYTLQIPISGDVGTSFSYLYFIAAGDGRPLPNNGWEITGRFPGEQQNRVAVLDSAHKVQELSHDIFSNDPGLSLITVSPIQKNIVTYKNEYSEALLRIQNPGNSDLHWQLEVHYDQDDHQEMGDVLFGRRPANPFLDTVLEPLFTETFELYALGNFAKSSSRWRMLGDSSYVSVRTHPENPDKKALFMGPADTGVAKIQSPWFLHETSDYYEWQFNFFITEYDGADYYARIGSDRDFICLIFTRDAQILMEHKQDSIRHRYIASMEWYAEWSHQVQVQLDAHFGRVRIMLDGDEILNERLSVLPPVQNMSFGHTNEQNVDRWFVSDIALSARQRGPAWLLAHQNYGSLAPGQEQELRFFASGFESGYSQREAELVFVSNATNSRRLHVPVTVQILPERQQISPFAVKDLRFRTFMLGGGPYFINVSKAFELPDNASFDIRAEVRNPDILAAQVVLRSETVMEPEVETISHQFLRIDPLRTGASEVVLYKYFGDDEPVAHQFRVQISPKLPPVQIKDIPNVRLVGGREPFLLALHEFFVDPAGHQLRFELSDIPEAIAEASVITLGADRSRFAMPGLRWIGGLFSATEDSEYRGPALQITPRDRGEFTLRVRALDPFGGFVEADIQVAVIADEAPLLVRRPEAKDVLLQHRVVSKSIRELFQDPDEGGLVVSAQSQNEEVVIANIMTQDRAELLKNSPQALRAASELRGGRIESVVLSDESVLVLRPIALGETEIILAASNELGRETEVRMTVRVLTEPDPIGPFALRFPEDFREVSIAGHPDQTLVFRWTKSNTHLDVRYEVRFDTEGGGFEAPLLQLSSNNSGRDTVLTLSYRDFDQHLEQLGIRRQTFGSLDWTVVAVAGSRRRTASTQQTLNINRGVVGIITFANVRGPEVREAMLGANAMFSATVTAQGFTGFGEASSHLRAWIGVHHENIPPRNWPQSAWMEASFRQSEEDSDIYDIQFGEHLAEGTYYVASRFSLVGQEAVIGGNNNEGGGFWHASERPSARVVFRELQLSAMMDSPTDFVLEQNFPNPFNPTTQIRYGLPEAADVRLSVYNMLGQEMAVLVRQYQSAGWYAVTFDATGMTSGTYIYRLQAGDFVRTRKMLFLR